MRRRHQSQHSATSLPREERPKDMKMDRLSSLICFGLICVASVASQLSPRGSRPVEPATRADKCDTQKEWPFCTTDEWGPKCPSGCRIQGLMNKYDHSLLKKIEKIRGLLDQSNAKYRNADQVSKQTYDYLKEKLVLESGDDNSYFDLAQHLRQRITDMKIKIDRQLGILGALKDRVKDQVEDMQRLEVDIDIKLRSCKGSCKRYSEYQVDKESYVALDKQLSQLDSHMGQSIESVGTLDVMKSQPMEAGVKTLFKSKDVAAQKSEDLFPGVKTMELILVHEGSKTSPATISKEPGTSYSPSPSSSSPTSTSTKHKSITEPKGKADDLSGPSTDVDHSITTHVSSKSITCSKSMRKTVVQTDDGPVDKMEEVIEGGPECHTMTETSKTGLSSLFPTFGGAEFGNLFGDDLGIFGTAPVEDDVPDFQARSVKTASIVRTTDTVEEDCAKVHQYHLNGEKNGLFKVKPGGTNSAEVVEVYCQQEGLIGGWLLVQQRENGTVSFNRSWAEYRDGFGSVDANGKGEFWLGNRNFHLLTNQSETTMKVELEDWEGGKASALYTVRVGSEAEGFPLHVSEYSGEAGDALRKADSRLSHNGMKFSTYDKDNDNWEENCAEIYGGGWWYNNCQASNLNGIYYKGPYDPSKNAPYEVGNGVVWSTYKPDKYSLKRVQIKIRPALF
ncbi:fibrinogen alpha chain-like [Brachionichthys hirsutus]|uniref:fibrinogen alpha chain-like n=1 Tax=Brachionichthys hirsutus TaxID=412623 RepID=UPI0036049FFF